MNLFWVENLSLQTEKAYLNVMQKKLNQHVHPGKLFWYLEKILQTLRQV